MEEPYSWLVDLRYLLMKYVVKCVCELAAHLGPNIASPGLVTAKREKRNTGGRKMDWLSRRGIDKQRNPRLCPVITLFIYMLELGDLAGIIFCARPAFAARRPCRICLTACCPVAIICLRHLRPGPGAKQNFPADAAALSCHYVVCVLSQQKK